MEADIQEFFSQRDGITGNGDADEAEAEAEAAGDMFSRCLTDFRDGLPEETKPSFRHYDSAEAMLADLRRLLVGKSGSRLMTCCSKVESFSRKLVPYFDVVNVFVQIKPDCIAGFWGSLMLICKLGTNVTSFFEKTTEMLERMSVVLPQYAAHLSVCLNRQSVDNTRLVRSLFLVYMDIIDFCKHLCAILSRGHAASVWKRAGFWGSVTWKPFHVRFEQLLARMTDHERIFRAELDISDGKMLNRIVDSQRQLSGLYSALQEKLNTHLTADSRIHGNTQAEQQLANMKSWLAARSNRQQIYEHSREKRVPGSGLWFISSADYIHWQEGLAKSPQMLLVKAKPGFGKTYLSTVIIDDLKQQTRPLAFFHFNQNVQVYDGVEPTQAIRAMAVQLLHQAREYPDTIDAVSLLMHSSWSGHTEASDGEAEAALEILCRLHSPYLVVDGVDESNNTDKVLTTMFTLCSVSDVSIITLGRPDIELPRRLAIDQTKPEIKIISPMEQNNIGDVRNFLQQEFDSMVELELFGTFDLSSNTVDSVAERAMGIFLWANLFVRYLNSHALTPRDRLEFLLESLRFEGLDGLCGAILNKLSRRMPMERALAARIFKWIGASIYPLTSEALHTALAINPGRQTTPQDHLAGFPSSLPVLSGALAEIDMFGRAAFIHLSVREYLMSPRCMDFPEFSLEDLASTHQYLAIRCLSYLAHDIPSEPLRYLPGNGPWTKGQDTTSPKLHHAHGREYLDNAHGYNINPMVTETPSNILLVSNLPMKMSIQDLSETFSSQPGFQAILLSKDDEKGITCSVEFDNTHHGVQALHEVDTSYYGNVRNSMRLSFASHSLHDDRTSPDVNRPYSYLAAPLRNVDRETDLRPAKKLRRSVKGVRVPPHPRREIPALDGMDPMVWDQHEIPVDRYPDQLDIGSDVRDYLPHRSKNVNAYTPVNHQDHMSAVHPGPDRPIHRAGVEQHYPLLKYATMFWPQHVRLSLHEKPQLSSRPRMQNDYSSTSRQPRQRSQYEPPYSFLGRPDGSSGSTTAMAALEGLEPTESGAPLWIPYLSRFLLRRGNFTTWVESSYCYRLTPSLRQILRIVKDIARDGSQDTGAQRELQWILHGLNQFSEALDELSAKHYQELRLDPTRLWDEDISAACDPDFWPTPSRAFASPMRESGSSTHTQGVHWLNAARSGLT